MQKHLLLLRDTMWAEAGAGGKEECQMDLLVALGLTEISQKQ